MMITKEAANALISLGKRGLAELLETSGYMDCEFETVDFVGVNNQGNFVYKTTSYDKFEGEMVTGFVYAYFDVRNSEIRADF